MNRAKVFLIGHAAALGKRIAARIGEEIAKVPEAKTGPKKLDTAHGKRPGRKDAMPSGMQRARYQRLAAAKPKLIARRENAVLLPLATCDEFTLYERAGRSTAQWRSLKLERRPRQAGRKNNWWLGWNGERLSHNADSRELRSRRFQTRLRANERTTTFTSCTTSLAPGSRSPSGTGPPATCRFYAHDTAERPTINPGRGIVENSIGKHRRAARSAVEATGQSAMADLSPPLGEGRKLDFGAVRSVDDPCQRPMASLPRASGPCKVLPGFGWRGL
jgi:hypothetical protein